MCLPTIQCRMLMIANGLSRLQDKHMASAAAKVALLFDTSVRTSSRAVNISSLSVVLTEVPCNLSR